MRQVWHVLFISRGIVGAKAQGKGPEGMVDGRTARAKTRQIPEAPSQSNGSVGDVVVSGTAREKAPGHRKVSVVEQEEEVGGVWLVGRK